MELLMISRAGMTRQMEARPMTKAKGEKPKKMMGGGMATMARGMPGGVGNGAAMSAAAKGLRPAMKNGGKVKGKK
jgi:hypothetical protein